MRLYHASKEIVEYLEVRKTKYEYYGKTVGAAMGEPPAIMGGGVIGPMELNIIE